MQEVPMSDIEVRMWTKRKLLEALTPYKMNTPIVFSIPKTPTETVMFVGEVKMVTGGIMLQEHDGTPRVIPTAEICLEDKMVVVEGDFAIRAWRR